MAVDKDHHADVRKESGEMDDEDQCRHQILEEWLPQLCRKTGNDFKPFLAPFAETADNKPQDLGPRRQGTNDDFEDPGSEVNEQPNYHHLEGNFTDTDSFSGDRLGRCDWRIEVVKHNKMATNISIRQYWHWLDTEEMFEHEVVRSKEKDSWGVYKEPIDFHLRLAELTEIIFAESNNKVIIGTKPVTGVAWRRELMAQFKRNTTKNRFLTKMEDLGIKPREVDSDFIESAWDKMQPEVLPSD
ncbi:hypothetical protein QBC46DRAFT_401008 [Diplogelasinospora grovesii]|uniref:Uncharacterized protein n=1 Tax=Diplogelasinospora grovesii TaxID=303347 RepID=A0AAN6RYW7_9PEZI|nr:hypothetical protein QBC46DRAFT_401008 [Diplogelasinospora grovesii]